MNVDLGLGQAPDELVDVDGGLAHEYEGIPRPTWEFTVSPATT